MSLDALLYLGVGDGKNLVHEIRERVVLGHGDSVSRRHALFMDTYRTRPIMDLDL
jgi:hypothetical protein